MGRSSTREEGARGAAEGPVPAHGHAHAKAREGRRRGASDGKTRKSRKKVKSGKIRALRWTASVLSLLILGTAGAGYLYYEYLNGKLKKEELNLGQDMADHKPNAAGQTPLNILLIGSDARDSKANQRLGGAKKTFGSAPLADVQMLVHLSADRSNISVVSMPRDTMLDIPECRDTKKDKTHPALTFAETNKSLGRGGPGCTVATWYKLTGIRIDHFMVIDFAGVVSMADAIGGVPVCVQENVHSLNSKGQGSHLKLKKGTTAVKGEQALQWLRTRYGFGDGTDLSRSRAQHMYMNSMVRELRKNTKLTDPNKLRKLAEAAIDSLTVSDTIEDVKALLDIGNSLKSVPTERITMTTMPNEYSKRPGFEAKVEPKPGDAEQLFQMIRDDVPLDGRGTSGKAKPKPSTQKPAEPTSDDPAAPADQVQVRVQNGTDGDGAPAARGRAAEITAALGAKGFTQAVATSVKNPRQTTVVRYATNDLEGDAQAVAKALGIPLTAVKKAAPGSGTNGITLIVGADWRTGDAFPQPKPKATGDDKAPEAANPLAGDDEGACMPIQPGFTW
ncbi:LCP family protein [Streptomyces sp. NPDC047315]|uniref:LCP family protein n=1 Tax=Streptomyces sp. NPDC047315 TaxID=3155142 RepID=UPI0033D628A2